MAVRRVTENRGKRTPGIDGKVWNTPHQKSVAVQSLGQRGYHPQPLRRVYIPKSSNPKKLRPLGIPTMADRAMQALYLLGLDPVAETSADPNSYGFRKERSPADAISQCFQHPMQEENIARLDTGRGYQSLLRPNFTMTGWWPTSRWTKPSSTNG